MATVPSTNPINVVISSAVPTLSAKSPPTQPTGSPGALSLQLETAEDDPFAHEMHSTSSVSVVPTAIVIVAATS